ncbi:hypothetical protein DFH07DRAFT_138702 [Mycena maculata]|uniref:Uncharacterized protein n=1 Tax=Mycena maculata TaxID=230809 RepID=A0AAD7NT84_9AGAR|nr:hypothetical protein DFH07DRAFT_138702 [Mycena maculata]
MSQTGHSSQDFLLLIENSSALVNFWPDLRDSYLPRLVQQLRGSHPAHLAHIFISESHPNIDDLHSSAISQYSSLEIGLKEVRFTQEPDNRLSTTQIQSAIEFLAFQTTSDARHLVIVATTPPTGFGIGHVQYDPWQELAKMLTQENIRLHLALTANLRSGCLPNLFEQALKWQQNTEEPLWLPTYSTSFLFRVSAPRYSDSVSADTKADSSAHLNSLASRELVPPDMYTTRSLDDVSSDSPSLVSQLQQVHGLTKKKVYGTKPARTPFIQEEGVRDRYRKAPTPLLMPSSSASMLPSEIDAPPPLSTLRGRSRSNPKMRHHRNVAVDPHAPRQTQWHKPLSSPEGDASDHSPYSASNLSLPSSPVAPMLGPETYPLASPSGDSTAPADPERFWSQPSTMSHMIHSSFYPPFSANPPVPGYIPSDNGALQAQASFHEHHSPATADFRGVPARPDVSSAYTTSPTYTAYLGLLPSPRSTELTAMSTPAQQELQANAFLQPQDAQGGSHLHFGYHHAPPVSETAPEEPIDSAFALPESESRIMQPTPVFPPIPGAAPALTLQARVEAQALSTRAQGHGHSYASPAAPNPPSSSRSGVADAGSKSSSLTGWAG